MARIKLPSARALRLLSGPIAFAAMWLVLGSLPAQQRAVGAVFGLTVAWWITEAIPLPRTSRLLRSDIRLPGRF